jgi:hypothetical protein
MEACVLGRRNIFDHAIQGTAPDPCLSLANH